MDGVQAGIGAFEHGATTNVEGHQRTSGHYQKGPTHQHRRSRKVIPSDAQSRFDTALGYGYVFDSNTSPRIQTMHENERVSWHYDLEPEVSRNGTKRRTAVPTGLGL
jgi:hypothetical protein